MSHVHKSSMVSGSRSLSSSLAARLSRSWRIVIALPIIVIVVLAGVLGPLLPLPDPLIGDLADRLVAPTWTGANPFGTDALGRDILSRMVSGARVTLLVAASAVLLASTIGTALGVTAGYIGGRFEAVVMRLTDLQLSIPVFVLVLALVAALGPSTANVILVLGIGGWMIFTRVVRAQALALKERDYVEASRALGASQLHVMRYDILPHVAGTILIIATLQIPQMIILESSLSFLGVGIQPPEPTWGNMVAEGRNYLATAWWVTTLPGLAIVATAVAFNLLGDHLRGRYDPKLAAEIGSEGV